MLAGRVTYTASGTLPFTASGDNEALGFALLTLYPAEERIPFA
jgi:hypothetical protein